VAPQHPPGMKGRSPRLSLTPTLRKTDPRTPAMGVRPEIPDPHITLAELAKHATGLTALSGDEHGEVPMLVAAGRLEQARKAARRYASWFGPDHFFIELQQTLTHGDTERNRRLAALAEEVGLGVVATNDVWYHVRDRHRLHDVLTA